MTELHATYSLQLRDLSADLYVLLNKLTYHSARLYNYALYQVKQHYEQTQKYIPYNSFYHLCKELINYKLLSSAAAQQTLKLLDRNYRSFFALKKKSQQEGIEEQPRPPHFLEKKSKFILVFPKETGFQIKDGKLLLAVSNILKKEQPIQRIELDFPTNINPQTVQEVRIIPGCNGKYFKLEIVYEDKEIKHDNLEPTSILAVDLGLNNLATCLDFKNGKAFILDGKWIKSINQFYNKERARLQSINTKQGREKDTELMFLITRNRFNQIRDFLHKTANHIINYCLQNGLGTLVVGHNPEWKQNINLGRKTNQQFVFVPFAKLLAYLKYRCARHDIRYIEVTESHTSKCSFLDYESIEHHDTYMGKRVKRGLFRTSGGVEINSDCNGCANIVVRGYGVLNGDDSFLVFDSSRPEWKKDKKVALKEHVVHVSEQATVNCLKDRERLVVALKAPSRIRLFRHN